MHTNFRKFNVEPLMERKIYVKFTDEFINKIMNPPHEATGALLECFILFPYFDEDYDILIKKGYMRRVSPDRCEWLKSKSSLAQYFKSIKIGKQRIKKGFWHPIQEVFGVSSNSLRKLAGKNGNEVKKLESIDFSNMKDFIDPERQKKLRFRKDTTILNSIEEIINEVKGKEADIVHDAVEQIDEILSEYNCRQKQKQQVQPEPRKPLLLRR